LGGIGPSQSDYFQAVKGHGHGDYRVPVLAPSSIGEAMALMADAFELAEKYRSPVMILADGTLGQAMEPVELQFRTPERIAAPWAVTGAVGRPPRVIKSIHLDPEGLEIHNQHLQAKFAQIEAAEVRFAEENMSGAELLIVAYGTAARVARSAVELARAEGLSVGIFRPISLWPYPAAALAAAAAKVRGILVVELSAGQMVEDVRLAVEGRTPIAFFGRTGGMIPTPGQVVSALHSLPKLEAVKLTEIRP
jgi:2-oxoglutarate ferredoxin oxidoreductase subunit alpha